MPRFACTDRVVDALAARLGYALAAVGVICIGLLWRSRLLPLPPFLVKYGGDALWAGLVYLIIRFGQPLMSIRKSAALAFGIAVAVEIAQLYHAPWIEAIRGTRVGALALGNTFNWPDIPAYGVGIVLATVTEERVCQGGKIAESRQGLNPP